MRDNARHCIEAQNTNFQNRMQAAAIVSKPGALPPTDFQMLVVKVLLQSGPCTLPEVHEKLLNQVGTSRANVEEALIALLNDGIIKADGGTEPVKFETVYDEPTKSVLLLSLSNVKLQSPDEIDAASSSITEYQFPVQPDIAARVAEQSQFLADLVSLPSTEIVSRLRVRYRFTGFPHLSRLADAILKQPLSCLSFDGERFWLTFNQLIHPVHLRGISPIPFALYDRFQIQSVPGLEEFLQYFGGMSIGWRLPASNYFLTPSDTVCVSPDDPSRDWGNIGDWEGSLLFYQGGTGDEIVIHPNGSPGAWFHDVAWESLDEIAFEPVGMSFPELIDHLATCIALPTDSPTWKESPFYY